jgi:dTDP-4-dehydrorhamnose 3,5-epimerase
MIDGVIKNKIDTNVDSRGFFREVFRFTKHFKKINIGQLSHSYVKEGVLKGWHGHKDQYQWNYISNGCAKIILFDDREDSITFGEKEVIDLDGNNSPIGYFFPPGVLHGYKCTKGPMHIMYVTSGTFNIEKEIRKPINYKELNKILIK